MKKTFLFLLIISCFTFNVFASLIYTVTKDKINVRVDSTVMSKSLGKLPKGSIVDALTEKYKWVKIKLPRNFTCYVSSEYIERIPGKKGRVTATSLNLRDRPSLNAYTIGKIPKGTLVSVLEKKGKWYKIRAYPHAYGWIHKKFLKVTVKKPNLNVQVKTLIAKLSKSDINKKANTHKKLIEKGSLIVPLLEAYLPRVNDNSVYSLILVLSRIGKTNPRLAPYFLKKALADEPKLAGIYLDIAQNIIQPPGERKAYFYKAQQGRLSSKEINKAKRIMQASRIKAKK